MPIMWALPPVFLIFGYIKPNTSGVDSINVISLERDRIFPSSKRVTSSCNLSTLGILLQFRDFDRFFKEQ